MMPINPAFGSKRSPLLLLALASALLAGSAGAGPEDDPYVPCAVDFGAVAKTAGLSLPSHPKISSDLLAVVERIGAAKSAKEVLDLKHDLIKGRGKPLFVSKDSDRSIQVYIALWDASEKAVDSLRAAGVEVEIVSAVRPLVQGFVPVGRLEKIADLDIVREVRLPSYGISTSSGRVVLESEAMLGVSYIRTRTPAPQVGFVDGTGVNVAVMSNALFASDSEAVSCGPLQVSSDTTENDGANFAPAELPVAGDPCDDTILAGYLGGVHPNPGVRVNPRTFTDHVLDGTLQDLEIVPYPEGAAMLEVVHDLAPGARLFYGRGQTTEYLLQSRDFYVGLNDPVDIIVENLVFTDDGRFDGSSAISAHATKISREHNIPFFVSAGGVTPADPSGVTEPVRFPMMITGFFNGDPRVNRARAHAWSRGAVENRDEGLNFDPVDGGGDSVPIDVTLVWDDYWSDVKPRAAMDIDMYLVPRATLSLSQAVAASTRVQNGNGTNPIERLTYFPPTNSQPLALVVVRADSTDNSRTLFTLVIESGRLSESKYLTHGIPLNNADALAPVVSVGDIDITDEFTIGSWAVPGRTPGDPNLDRFLRWHEGQVSPTVVSYGSVSTLTTRLRPSPVSERFPQAFWGPSAAASNMAGFAALLLHRFPEMPTYRLGQLLSDDSGVADNGETVSPFAKDVTPGETRDYPNAPRYLRTNGLALYAALEDGKSDPYGLPETKIKLPEPSMQLEVAEAGEGTASTDRIVAPAEDLGGWSSVVGGGANVGVTEMGLEISGGSPAATAAWVSPLLGVQNPGESEPRTELRADRMYELDVRVGSTETDPLKVPDFRLSVQSDGGDEAYSVTVANSTGSTQNAPTTIGGKQYRVLFRPSSEEIAKAGFRFVFELLGASEGDNAAATLVLREVTLKELLLPQEPEAAGQ